MTRLLSPGIRYASSAHLDESAMTHLSRLLARTDRERGYTGVNLRSSTSEMREPSLRGLLTEAERA